jgi:hypothetical protein
MDLREIRKEDMRRGLVEASWHPSERFINSGFHAKNTKTSERASSKSDVFKYNSFAKNLSLVRGGEGSDGIFWGIFGIVSLHVCSNVLFRLGLDYIRQCSSGLFLLTFLLHQSVGYLQN